MPAPAPREHDPENTPFLRAVASAAHSAGTGVSLQAARKPCLVSSTKVKRLRDACRACRQTNATSPQRRTQYILKWIVLLYLSLTKLHVPSSLHGGIHAWPRGTRCPRKLRKAPANFSPQVGESYPARCFSPPLLRLLHKIRHLFHQPMLAEWAYRTGTTGTSAYALRLDLAKVLFVIYSLSISLCYTKKLLPDRIQGFLFALCNVQQLRRLT